MADRYMQTLLTPSVRKAEKKYYGEDYPLFDSPEKDPLRDQEIEMIQSRDSFYMATVVEHGWPYLQHRGGPKGFLRVIDQQKIGFADYRGNRQMSSVGNLSDNDRVSLFLIDYQSRTRLKILGHAQVLDARENVELAEKLSQADSKGKVAKPERLFLIDILSYDWNCPKFITPRFTKEDIAQVIDPLKNRIAELEARLAYHEQVK